MLLLCLLLQAPAFAMAAEQPAQADIRYVTVHGQVDPRLQVSILSWYRSTDDDNPDCTRRDWNTGTQKRTLTVRGETGLRNQFTVKVPIDFVGKDGCGWEYSSTKLQMTRYQDNKYKNFSRYMLLSDRNKGRHTERYTGSYINSGLIPQVATTDKKHYFLGEDLRFECQSYPYTTNKEKVHFYCLPQEDIEWENGVDQLTNLEIRLNIAVDESEEAFIEYQPTFFEQVELFFDGLF
jgi:hypothetical protein